MANPNVDVWGESSSWRQIQYLPATEGTGYSILKATKPRIPTFATNDGTLAAGNTAGKTPINQSLDPTICPCGQDPAISPFAKIRFFKNHQSDALNKVPDQTVTNNNPCNWFLYEGTGGSLYTDHVNETGAAWRWLPNATINNNMDGRIVPYTFWQTKSLLIYVSLVYITGYYNGTPQYSTMSLNDWIANPTRKIADIHIDFLGVDNASLSGISYKTGSAAQMSDGRWGGVGYIGKVWSETERYILNVYNRSLALDVIGHLKGNSYASSPYFAMYNYDMFEGAELKAKYVPNQTQYGWDVWVEIPYSETNYNKVLSIAALFGCPFTTSPTKRNFGVDFTDIDLYLPIIDDNGIAHGEYTHGAANATNPFNSKDSVRDYNYDPHGEVDPNTYNNITGFNSLTSGATMTKRYVLDAANVEKLGDDLWTICGSLSSTDFEYFDGKLKDEFLTTNPIDSIISLQRYPFNIPSLGVKAPIKLGKTTVTAEGATTYFPFNSIVFAGKDIFPRFGNCFLDYEPYTSYEVYVPFCGTTKIRAADILGHTLNIQMQIDLSTGSCTAYIMADQLVIETLNGSCGVEQTLSGSQTATVNANIFNGILNQKAADRREATTIGKMIYPTGWISAILNPVGGYENIENAKTQAQIANYEITHTEVPPHKIGAASPLLGWCQEFDARIIIYYPEGDVIDSTIPPSLNAAAIQAFGHDKGFGTVSPGTVSSFHGYTQGTIIADQIPCTESERNRIKEAFSSGVFLP